MNVLKFFLWLFLSLSFIDVVLGQEQNASNQNVESTTLDQEFHSFLEDLPTIVSDEWYQDPSSQEGSEGSVIEGLIDHEQIRQSMINIIANKVWEDSSDQQYNRLVIEALVAYMNPSILASDPSVHFLIKKSLIDFFMALSRKYEEESLEESMQWGSTLKNSFIISTVSYYLFKGVAGITSKRFPIGKIPRTFFPQRLSEKFRNFLLLLGVPIAMTGVAMAYNEFIEGPRINSLILIHYTLDVEMYNLSVNACSLSQEVKNNETFYRNDPTSIEPLQEGYEKLNNMYKLMNEHLPRFRVTQKLISDRHRQSMENELALLDDDLDPEDINEERLQLYRAVQDNIREIRGFAKENLRLTRIRVPYICKGTNGNMGITEGHLLEIGSFLSSFQEVDPTLQTVQPDPDF